jgi:hypothetical protein
MPVYSVKNDETLAIRAFSSSRAAYDFGSRQQVFSNDGELYNTSLTDDQLRDVYYLVTGFETRVQYRDYLCELIFNAIEAAGLPLTDKENDCAIVSAVEPVDNEPVNSANEPVNSANEPVNSANEPVNSANEPVDYLNETVEPEPIEDTIPGIVHLIPEPPTPDHDPITMEPDLSFIEPEPENVIEFPTSKFPPPDHPLSAVYLEIIEKNLKGEDIDEETEKRLTNAMIYGISHPEMYKTAPKINKKDLVLSDTPKTKYSRREKSIFETIVEAYPEPITTRDIIERKFKSYKKYHVKNAIAVTTKSLASKIAYNDEPFLLKIGGKSGPKPMIVWIEGKGEEND